MIKAVLFDLDGTLINTNDLIIKSFKYAFKKHFNKDISREEVVKTFGEPLRDAMVRYDKDNADLLLKLFRSFNESNHDELASKFKGVEQGLKGLKDMGMKLAIVTSKRRNMALRSLKLIEVFEYMDVIVCPEDTEKHKPLGDPALKACEKLNVLPEEALMVGDSHNDLLCGKNAGCKTCLVKYTALSLKELMKYDPDYVIDSVEDLIEVCKHSDEEKVV
ncbi:pyrophosphatase PpaX [Clostridium sp. P21]|uniref:Pyrophosphatase PpaX n=1 Tax=Clostridium muellerianum TaxID=2716538 RepID=A0A7Y0EJX9_9CLOT|nr:pyrophosphatase PpaX [Clostridium muellerianum]NMM64856.1 pyrophosphatase PpaX [Clostridium muellerianum]